MNRSRCLLRGKGAKVPAAIMLAIALLCGLCFSSIAAEISRTPVPAEALIVDSALARRCLAEAQKGDRAAGNSLGMLLCRNDRQDFERLAALVRAEAGVKAVADAAAVPPRGNLSIAWLLNYLGAQSETLAFDMAVDGFFVRRVGPGKRYRFRPFGEKEIIVHMDAATLGRELHERNMQGASRLFLRMMPDGKEYYVAALRWLIKNRNEPPAPNPEGRYVPGLMNQSRSEDTAIHYIVIYENNVFKEKKLASEFPESMRYREYTVHYDNGETAVTKVPVARIEILLLDADEKLTATDKISQLVIKDYAEDGTLLYHNTMAQKVKRMKIDLLELIRFLKANRPVTYKTLATLGFSNLHKKMFPNATHYTDIGILLNDGNVIDKIELREAERESLLIVNFGEHAITKEILEEEFGELRLFAGPTGKSMKEAITYINDSVDKFIVMVDSDQTTKEIIGFSIKSALQR